MNTLLPVILVGGSGTRLWPLSRSNYPKQFLRLFGERSMFQETVLRTKNISNALKPLIICNEAHYFLCLEHLSEIGIDDAELIIEPVGRNTAPAIAIAAMYAKTKYQEDISLLVLPSDHLIKNIEAFSQAVTLAASSAERGKLVTFGAKPTSPETGYGYIEAGNALSEGIFDLKKFTEKPSREIAQQFIESGNYYWNAGIFLFQAKSYLQELKAYAKDIYDSVKNAFENSMDEDRIVRIDPKKFEACRSESIDYAVMEHTDKGAVVPIDVDWSDLGCWNAVHKTSEEDDNQNVLQGNVIAQETQNCFIHTEEPFVSTAGVKDLIIVATKDSVLVANKSHSQHVKDLVSEIKNTDNSQLAAFHTKVYRPWGHYESLIIGENFQAKHIVVKPGQKLSLQLHHHRAEHWVVVSGKAEVVCGEKVFELTANQSTYIPKETKHRLTNIGTEPLHIIEVQTGDYLGEDDIVRFEDVYGRIASSEETV
ncbi:MAG: mannose-1-phosphate guanylyltransferase/mannose-6-phosphate isomerase [Gammaproteobacteria bacterium]